MQETFSLATNQSIMTCVDSIECNIRPVVLLVRARCRLAFVQWICGQESDARRILTKDTLLEISPWSHSDV